MDNIHLLLLENVLDLKVEIELTSPGVELCRKVEPGDVLLLGFQIKQGFFMAQNKCRSPDISKVSGISEASSFNRSPFLRETDIED
jgi:hypothetical protein